MKFIKKFTIMFLFFATLFALTSCFDVAGATGIAVTKMPKSTYYVNEIELKDIDLEVTIYYSSSSETFNYSKAIGKGVKFTGFDLSQVGNYTATVSFEGLSTTFNYSVIAEESVFAGGNGTAISPYLVSTPEQFKHMGTETAKDKTKYLYFKLINDINLDEITLTNPATDYAPLVSFSGSLDGDGYKIMLSESLGNEMFCVFNTVPEGVLQESVIKNLTYETTASISLFWYNRSPLKFYNVVTRGLFTATTQNDSPYIGHALNNLTFENCTNYLNSYGTGQYGSLFLGGYAGYKTKDGVLINDSIVVFKNCVNYGSIEGINAGIFVGNYGAFTAGSSVVFENCINYGKATGENTGLIVGDGATYKLKSYPGVTSEANLFNDIPKKSILSLNTTHNSPLMLNTSSLTSEEKEPVKSVKIVMYFRTYELGTDNTNRYSVTKDILLSSFDNLDTGFKNWYVTEPQKAGASSQGSNYKTGTPVQGGNYQYILDGDDYYYYFTETNSYLKMNEPTSFYFKAFLYDENGKLVYVTNSVLMNIKK